MDNQIRIRVYKELGRIIKARRTRSGLRQEELAKHIGLSRASIVNMEKGRHRPQIHLLYDLSKVFNCKPTELMPNEGSLAKELLLESGKNLSKKEVNAMSEVITKAKTAQKS